MIPEHQGVWPKPKKKQNKWFLKDQGQGGTPYGARHPAGEIPEHHQAWHPNTSKSVGAKEAIQRAAAVHKPRSDASARSACPIPNTVERTSEHTDESDPQHHQMWAPQSKFLFFTVEL